MSGCSPIEIALYNPRSELINSDEILSYLGQSTFKCITSGSVIGTPASAIILLEMVLERLDLLSGPTGCRGLSKNGIS